jgi:hypothetical protein
MHKFLDLTLQIMSLILIVLCLLIWMPFFLADVNMAGLHVACAASFILLVSYLVHKTRNAVIRYVQPLVAATSVALVLARLISYRDILLMPTLGPTVTVWIPFWTRTFKTDELVGLGSLFTQLSIIMMFAVLLLFFSVTHVVVFLNRKKPIGLIQ